MASVGLNACADVDASLGIINVDTKMASMGSSAGANVDASLEIVSGVDDKSSLRRGWDGLAMPAKDETGRVCHSPISPILARALQYFDEMPDSKDSGGNAEEYAEDEESLAEELQSACRCEPFRLPRGACPSRISLPQHSPPHLSHRPCSARIAPCGPDRTQTDGGGSRPGVAGGDSNA
jgi:hypothetical protein